jgi:hypothetical protein
MLNSLNQSDTLLQSGCHFAVHLPGIIPFYEERRPAKAEEKTAEFVRFNSRKDCGICYFVSVQVKDGQHRTVPGRIQKFCGVQGCEQGPRLGLTISDRDDRYQIRVVKRRAEGVGHTVAQFAPFVNRTWCFGSAMAANSPGK